jgi:hypothetical protein
MKEASSTMSTSFALLLLMREITFSSIILLRLSSPTFHVNLLSTLLEYVFSPTLIRHSLLSLWSTLRSRVISLRLRTPLIFMTMKVLKMPNGLLGGLPGPSV